MWDFGALLPIADPPVSLGEGWTPLVAAPHAASDSGKDMRVLIKLEGCNPSGAFKDRLNSVAVSVARGFGFSRVLCTTTGNHGVSLAAYAAAAGMRCLVACSPVAETAAVRQMRLYGAEVVVLDGSPEAGRQYLADLVHSDGWYPSVRNHPRPYANPFGLEGYKTIAFEIWEQLGGTLPHAVLVPTGGGDSLAGVARGFRDLVDLGLARARPLLVACQAAAAPSLVRARAAGAAHVTPIKVEPTQATSISEDATGDHALRALAESGEAVAVSEDEITAAVRRLGRDGLCVEPASAVSAAALGELTSRGLLSENATVVCIATASGVRWQETFADIDKTPTRRSIS